MPTQSRNRHRMIGRVWPILRESRPPRPADVRTYVRRLCWLPSLPAAHSYDIDSIQLLAKIHHHNTHTFPNRGREMDDTQPALCPERRPACHRLLGRSPLLPLFPGIVAVAVVALQLPSLATAAAFVPHAAPHVGAWTLLGSQVGQPPNPIDRIQCPSPKSQSIHNPNTAAAVLHYPDMYTARSSSRRTREKEDAVAAPHGERGAARAAECGPGVCLFRPGTGERASGIVGLGGCIG